MKPKHERSARRYHVRARRPANYTTRETPATAGAFFVDSKTATIPTCVYCSGKHFSASCETVIEIGARKEILKREKRCFVCLKRGHHHDQCERNCRKSKQRHHQSICQARKQSNPPNNATPATSRSSVNLATQERSDGSTIHESSNTKLRCGGIVATKACSINISALTFPVICSPFPVKVSVTYPHLDGLELAYERSDTPDGTIDLLIGSNYYWDFVTGETKRGGWSHCRKKQTRMAFVWTD